MTLGELLKERRLHHELSQEQVADYLGISRQAVAKWEGNQSSPSADNLLALSTLYQVSLDELVGIPQEIPQAEKKARASQEILSLYEAMIESKNQWLHRLFVCCCVLTLVLIFLVIFDLMNPSVGFFRG